VSRLGLGSGGCALVAGTAQELGHLGLPVEQALRAGPDFVSGGGER
jgi:hypothetical protein